MARFLLSAMPFTGHVAPMLALAETLVARGHDVRVHTGSAFVVSVLFFAETFSSVPANSSDASSFRAAQFRDLPIRSNVPPSCTQRFKEATVDSLTAAS